MRDHELFALVLAAVKPQLPADWRVRQSFQPTGQTTHSGPTLYFFKAGERRVGAARRVEVWDSDRQDYDHEERQQVATVLRFQAVVDEADPDNTLSSADMASEVAQYLQSDATRAALKEGGVAPLRISALPAIQLTDLSDEYLRSSSLDFEVVYYRVIVARTPAARMGDVSIHAV